MDVWGERIVYTEIPKKKHFFVDILDFEFSSLNLNIGVEYTPPPPFLTDCKFSVAYYSKNIEA